MLWTLCLADEKYCEQLVTGYWEVQEIKDANRNSTIRLNAILTNGVRLASGVLVVTAPPSATPHFTKIIHWKHIGSHFIEFEPDLFKAIYKRSNLKKAINCPTKGQPNIRGNAGITMKRIQSTPSKTDTFGTGSTCPSYRESNKGSKERQGQTLGVRFREVSVKRESTVYKLRMPNWKMYPGVGTVLSSIEPPCATTSRKRPPPISDRQSKRPKFSQSKPYSWSL